MEEISLLEINKIVKTVLNQMVHQVAKRKKGGFKKDGSTHHSGINNEQKIVQWLNQEESMIGKYLRPETGYVIEHKGGTQCKADAVVLKRYSPELNPILIFTLSIKNHKTGTFDWLNSTKGFPEEWSAKLKEKTKEIKAHYQNHQNIDISREEVDTLFSNALSDWKNNHSFIHSILYSIYEKYTDGILVHVEKNHSLVYFEKRELKELRGFCGQEYTYSLKHKEGTCSASILRINKNTKEEINTNLRIRLVLNNGVNALVGTSSKNKTSVPCIKIQQDQVDDFLNKIENKKVESYI